MAARTQKKKVRIQRGVGTGLGSSVKAVYKQARKVGGRVVHAAAETPEFIQATRNDRAFRAEMDDHYRAIGKRVVALHKRAHAESPFSRFKAIMKELEAFTSIEEEYRANRVRLSELRQEIRGSKKS